MKNISAFVLIMVASIGSVQGQNSTVPELNEMNKYEGYFDFYYSEKEDKIYLHVDKIDSQFLYVSSLSQGIGNNDLGLDRGQLGGKHVVYFQKRGSKLLLTAPNLKFRANTENELEQKSVEQAFAKSVLFGFPILDTTDTGFLIDFTSFVLRDAHKIGTKLKSSKEGSYKLDLNRSALALDHVKAFPKNVEFEALITLEGVATGNKVHSVSPIKEIVTVYQHHSFIELPDIRYKTRKFDKRAASFPIRYMDYGNAIDEAIVEKLICRHRLEKKNPLASMSEAVEPIIYYLDNGTPEPVRSALLEGASWWNQAFEAIGFKDAFQVKMLPAEADPMDVRYNVIQWVHRSTRGWSYGDAVTDPRTGEIIKGHVSLGSLRVRQDFLIAQGLTKEPFAISDENTKPMMEMALARIRQLGAHEVGHTLGFNHNFAASTKDRASVMDYPHPLVNIVNGKIDYSNAYAVGIGEWDKIAVAYAYGVYINEEESLNKVLDDAAKAGYRNISDEDSRDRGGCNPYGHLWDNGADAVDELKNVLAVRKKAIEQFSIHNIRSGEGHDKLEEVFVPLYFYHRYQTEAAVKLIAGIDFHYGQKGDGLPLPKVIDVTRQREALNAILETTTSEVLAIPQEQLQLMAPRGMYSNGRETMSGKTGPTFDAIGAATTSANFTFKLLLHPARASRLIQQNVMDENQLSLEDVLDELLNRYVENEFENTFKKEIHEAVNAELLTCLMSLAQDEDAYAHVGSAVDMKLAELQEHLDDKKSRTKYDRSYLHDLNMYFKDPSKVKKNEVDKIPDGSPIGSGCSYE